MIRGMPITEARGSIGEIVNRVSIRGERVPLTRNGKTVAVVVPVADVELLERLEDEADLRESDRRLADPSETRVPFAELRKRLGL